MYGYELLFRSSRHVNAAHVVDTHMASARVVLDSLLEFGLDALVADRRAFINAPRSFLVEGVGFALPKDRVVIEVLENVPCDPEVVSAVEALATAGYPVALDDFVFRDELRALLPYSTVVKLDVSVFDEAALDSQIKALSDYPVELLAERVETPEIFERCRALGFRYFQGFFFARPTIVQGEGLGASLADTSPGAWFAVGLFSSVDLFVDAPLKEVLASLPLSPEIVAAVTNSAGRLGTGLSAVLAFERGDRNRVRCETLSPGDFTAAYRVAIQWAREWETNSHVASVSRCPILAGPRRV